LRDDSSAEIIVGSMRSDANKIGLQAIRSVLDGAKPFDIDIGDKKVTAALSREDAKPWPERGLQGLEAASSGPLWPAPVLVTCQWDGGKCTLRVSASYWRTKGRHRHQVAFRVRVVETRRTLLWITVPTAIGDAVDGKTVKVQAALSTFKRKDDDLPELGQKLNSAMREVAQESKLPLVSAANAEVCDIEIPSAAVLPSAEIVFKRLVHLALLKLDFVDRGTSAQARGKPLIDLDRWEISAEQLAELQDDEDEDGERDEAPGTRRYWGGGFGERDRLASFLEKSYWQINWARDAKELAAKRTWRRFAEVQIGDWFVIKGYGGTHDLVAHLVGEVTTVDAEQGRVDLKRLDIPLFKGKAPRGLDAGSWQDTLVPITRPDVIEALFKVKAARTSPTTQTQYADPRLNLIFYGPPGTGKTFRLRALRDAFTRKGEEQSLSELARRLKWYQILAIAIQAAGGAANVDTILKHPLLRAKYAEQAIPTPLRQVVWGTLGQHTVETSTTVKMKRRLGELLFDKREDGTWFLFDKKLPDDLALAVGEHESQKVTEVQDYKFVTFHQSYAYEDFIEGIRPEVSPQDDEPTLSYTLEDGIFKQAVRGALALAGYDGSVDEFCKLPAAERRRMLENAPPYAVFIDEINRGNVARILGELITLIEPDKRLGAEHELIVDLPHSRTKFGVPRNLYVIGTMNTADRSVEALDAALRRRFDFEEQPPLPSLLRDITVGDIDLEKLLETINRRLEKLYDRDHAIGHAYLLPLKDNATLEELKRIFRDRILPLLQEYFFGDWGKIGLVLGKDFVVRRADDIRLADFHHDDRDRLMERPSWELSRMDSVTNHSFRKVYEVVEES
jgi:5-methylcytosine-specific restriction protein B